MFCYLNSYQEKIKSFVHVQDNILCMFYGFNITFLSYENILTSHTHLKGKHVYLFVKAATIEDEKASIENDVKNRMEKTIENIRSNFNSIRTDKSNSAMLDKIEVEYYGSPVNLKSIAQISTPNANSILVQPYYKSSFSTFGLCLDSLSECDHQLSQYSKLDPLHIVDFVDGYFSIYVINDECPTFQQPSLSNGKKRNSDVKDFQQLKTFVDGYFSIYVINDECPTFQQPSLSNGKKGNPDVNDFQQLKTLFYFWSMFGLFERM
ncbi:hypothetical protein Lal_00029036 [Lupinus albus]|nr:hypothetical protein Lal_00023289 [Lupinus albus]KAF1885147.1 hypothetical protein Lal_00029036 [Lupinus albus]